MLSIHSTRLSFLSLMKDYFVPFKTFSMQFSNNCKKGSLKIVYHKLLGANYSKYSYINLLIVY